jgi:uncharacterized protein YutE (UPF0331/DUF86 family)
MTELDRALVRRKLATIAQNLTDLETVAGLSLEAYRADRLRRKAAERLVQEIVEAAVDVNIHLLRTAKASAPADYYTSFIALGREGFLPADLAERLASAAGLRNGLVHEYDAIDDAIVLRAVGEARRDFREYVAAIETALASP